MYVVLAIAIILSISSGYTFVDTQDQTNQDRSHIPQPLRNLEPCQVEGYAEDPTNCARFYRCVNYAPDETSSLLLRHRFWCAPGTIFDSALSNCNHPDKMTIERGCQVELPGTETQVVEDEPRQSRQRSDSGRGFIFEDDNKDGNDDDSDTIQVRRLARTKFRGSANTVSEEVDSAPGGDIDQHYLRPPPLVKEEFLNNFVSYTENRTTATFTTTKETTFAEYDEVTEPAPFVLHQIQIPYV